MTAMTLDPARIQRLAETEDYPTISAGQLTLLVGTMTATSDPNDDDSDPAWDLAWSIAEHWLDQNRPRLAGSIIEVGYLAEQLYPFCQAEARENDGEAA